jgi:hypothetical protein
VDLGSWWCNCNNFMGENVAFSMNSISILLYCAEKDNALKLLANFWLIFTCFRYLEYMNGLGIIHCRQKYGFALTLSHVIQVCDFSHSYTINSIYALPHVQKVFYIANIIKIVKYLPPLQFVKSTYFHCYSSGRTLVHEWQL